MIIFFSYSSIFLLIKTAHFSVGTSSQHSPPNCPTTGLHCCCPACALQLIITTQRIARRMAPPQQQKATTTTIAPMDEARQRINERLRATGVRVQFNEESRIGKIRASSNNQKIPTNFHRSRHPLGSVQSHNIERNGRDQIN